MDRTPAWVLVPAVAAPVLLIGGWMLAAALQPPSYDPVRDTISALASRRATDRWVMTAALALLGICYLATALGLRPARRLGRLVLGLGGVATVLVAAFPQPAQGSSQAHTTAASATFAALALWPSLSGQSGHRAVLLRRGTTLALTAVLAGLVLWFYFDLGGDERGLAERFAAGAEALGPLAIVLSIRRA